MLFNITGAISPRLAATIAFRLLTRVGRSKFREQEMLFYRSAHRFTAPFVLGEIPCYEIGDPTGKLVLLVHGWESNAGSMSGIGQKLADLGYHVISMDLPAHGHNKGTHTNLFECKEALRAVIARIQPAESFSVVAHSLGSMVTAFALSETTYSVDQWVLLTSPDRIASIFEQFRDTAKLPKKSHEVILHKVEEIFGEPLENLTVSNKAKEVKYQNLTLIHDSQDKVLSYDHAQNITAAIPQSTLHTLHTVGHYRMLWNAEVQSMVVNLFQAPLQQAASKPIMAEDAALVY